MEGGRDRENTSWENVRGYELQGKLFLKDDFTSGYRRVGTVPGGKEWGF